MLLHQEDFGATAECHFFATCHGKGACDGIGGTVKRLARQASLQRKLITNAKELHDWAVKEIKGIEFMYISTGEIEQHVSKYKLKKRHEEASTIAGTRSHHAFLQHGPRQVLMRKLSSDSQGTISSV